MATESIFHNMILNSPEDIENFVTAMEKAEEMENFANFPDFQYINGPSPELVQTLQNQFEKHES